MLSYLGDDATDSVVTKIRPFTSYYFSILIQKLTEKKCLVTVYRTVDSETCVRAWIIIPEIFVQQLTVLFTPKHLGTQTCKKNQTH